MSPQDRDREESERLAGTTEQSSRSARSDVSARTRFAKKVGARIRRRRAALGLRQEDVIRRMPHPADEVRGPNRRHTLSQYECGKALPSLEIVVALATALETAPEWLAFGRSGDPSVSEAVVEDLSDQGATGAAWTQDPKLRRLVGADDQSVITSICGSSFKPGIIGNQDIALVENGAAIGDRPRAAVLSGSAGAVLGIATDREGRTMVSRDGSTWSDSGLDHGELLGLLMGVFVWRPAAA